MTTIEIDEINLETWFPAIIPALKARWDDYLAGLPASQQPPVLADWLALCHAAATTPEKIPAHLTQLLHEPRSGQALQNGWITLTSLFELTFATIRTEEARLDPAAWRSLLALQNRILTAAANLALIRETRPSTDILSRRALYLQTVNTLHRQIIAGGEPADLLDEVTTLIQENFGYDYINLFLLDSSRQLLTLHSIAWKSSPPGPRAEFNLKVGGPGIASRVATTGQVMLVNDVSQSAAFVPHPALPAVQAELAVPLIIGNNLIGVLDIQSDQVEAFCEDDRQILQAIGDHVAFAIENARLQNALRRHLREKTQLYESNIALGTSLDMDTVLKLMTQKIAEAFDTGACVICLADEKVSTVTAVAEYVRRYPGNPARTWRTLNTPLHLAKDPIGQRVLKATRPVIGRAGADRSAEDLVWQFPPGHPERKPGWGVVLALPLETDKRIIGFLEIYDRNSQRTFSTEDIQMCRILASQATLALERARLFSETQQRLAEVTALYTMAQKISGNLDLQSVLDTIVISLRQVIGCRGCCIFLIDQTGQSLEIKAADGLKPRWRQMAKLSVGEGAAGQAAAENRSVYIPDTRQEPGFIFFDEEVRSLLVIPLLAHGKVIGTINVDDRQPDAFGPAEERLLAIAAVQAAVAIDNARLFGRVSAEQQQMQAIIQYMADGVLLIDAHGFIVTCNPALAMMLHMHPGQIIGQNVTSPNLPQNLAGITAITTHRARTGVLSSEVTVYTPKPRSLQVFSTTVVDNNKLPVGEVRVVHDVTREREFEQMKNDFMSTISHELRTPLFSIQGFVQIMLEDEHLEAATRVEFLNIIQHQAAQLAEMVNNLLDLSRFDEGRLEFDRRPTQMLDVVHRTVLKLQGFAHRQKVNLLPELPDTLPLVIGDAQRLEQVLTNLIGNAIKFTNEEGHIWITASAGNQEILIEVRDDGIGIPADALERIFSRYYQVEDRSERSAMGSGLGLHIAQKIVEGHGGRIWAENAAGHGSIFRFTLPTAEV